VLEEWIFGDGTRRRKEGMIYWETESLLCPIHQYVNVRTKDVGDRKLGAGNK